LYKQYKFLSSSPIAYGHHWIMCLAIEKGDFQNEIVAQEVWKSSFLFNILALLLCRPSTSYFASTIRIRDSLQSNLVLYTFGPAPMCELKSSYNKPASCSVHRGGLLVWSASILKPRTLHLFLPHFDGSMFFTFPCFKIFLTWLNVYPNIFLPMNKNSHLHWPQ
jgi:hypothetical protein